MAELQRAIESIPVGVTPLKIGGGVTRRKRPSALNRTGGYGRQIAPNKRRRFDSAQVGKRNI